jgi:hypothetical protein
LPTPPVPVSVRRRTSRRRSSALISATSCSRPTSGVKGWADGGLHVTSVVVARWSKRRTKHRVWQPPGFAPILLGFLTVQSDTIYLAISSSWGTHQLRTMGGHHGERTS